MCEDCHSLAACVDNALLHGFTLKVIVLGQYIQGRTVPQRVLGLPHLRGNMSQVQAGHPLTICWGSLVTAYGRTGSSWCAPGVQMGLSHPD